MCFFRKKLFSLWACLLWTLPMMVQAEEEALAVTEEALPRSPLPPKKEKPAAIIKAAKAIILIDNPQEMLKGSKLDDTRGVQMIGIQVPGKEKWLKRRLSHFIGEEISSETIDSIKEVISDYYRESHHPFVLIQVPNQEVTSGVLQLLILEGHLGEVQVEGNKWTSTERLIGYTHLRPDQAIDEGRLLNDVSFMNRNPFRRVDIVYAPGEQIGTTNVILATKDRRPLRVYAGSENTGIEPVGRGRWYTGFNWGNAFGLDHILSYQFTSAFNIHRFHAHTVEYIAPLPWHHVLNICGGYSEVHPKVHRPIRRNSGWSMQGSLRYTIPLQIYRYLEHEITAGFDFKRTNNTFEFSENYPRFGKNVNLSQLVFGYGGNYERNHFRLDFNGDIYWSPGGIFADQSNADYESLRPDAKNRWVYFRGSFVYLQRLPKAFSFSFLARGQISSQNLLPSEQFGLGGYDTVRGYDQRELNKDGAILLSTEARSPALPVIKPWNDAVQFLIFLDYGWGDDHNALPQGSKADYLLGTGPGMRYTIEPYLTARLDWGIKLHKQAGFGGGNTMIHFNITASY